MARRCGECRATATCSPRRSGGCSIPPSPAARAWPGRSISAGRGALRSFQSSLDRLGLDRVDILYIHDPDDHYDRAVADTVPVLLELKAQGRVKAIGAGMNQWQMELAFARQGHFDCFLLAGRYTLLDQTALPEFLPYCVEHGISVVAGGPYNSGILAVGPREGATFNYRAASAEMMDKARRVAAVCERHRVPLRAAALQFILAHPAIASVIPGARSVAEVEENVALVEHPIPDRPLGRPEAGRAHRRRRADARRALSALLVAPGPDPK